MREECRGVEIKMCHDSIENLLDGVGIVLAVLTLCVIVPIAFLIILIFSSLEKTEICK